MLSSPSPDPLVALAEDAELLGDGGPKVPVGLCVLCRGEHCVSEECAGKYICRVG